MRGKITKRTVDGLAKDDILWDTELKGFGVKRLKDGGASFLVRYRAGTGRGAPIRTLIIGRHGPLTPDKARSQATIILGQVEDGGDPAADKSTLRKKPTVKEFAPRFLSEHVDAKRKPSTAKEYKRLIDLHIVPAFGGKKVPDVKRIDVVRLHNALGKTPYQANRVLAVASKMFSFAENVGIRPDHSNPCHKVERFPETARECLLTVNQLAALGAALREAEDRWAQAQPLFQQLDEERIGRAGAMPVGAPRSTGLERMRAIKQQIKDLGPLVIPEAIAAIRLLIFSGARKSEILTLQREWISEDGTGARLPDSKTGAKTLHFPPAAVEVLDGAAEIAGNAYVIPGRKEGQHLVNLSRPWGIIRKAAGLEHVRLHDLRHVFASTGVSSGMGLPIIGNLLGHADPKTTQRYAHLAADPVKAAAASIAGKIADAMERTPAELSDERNRLNGTSMD